MTQLVRRSFTLTQRDLEIIRVAREKCGFVNDSEALRAIIKFFEQHAPCMRV